MTHSRVTQYRAIRTAEKRAQLEAAGEEWPIGSDGLPKIWCAHTDRPAGGEWKLRSVELERGKKTRRSRGLKRRPNCGRIGIDELGVPFCIHGAMAKSGKSWKCSSRMSERQKRYDESPHRKLQRQLYGMTQIRIRH